MVGVPGRSKGCHACRRRKKGCDLERPSCARCRKAGIPCDGYERERIFVHTNPGPEKPRLRTIPKPRPSMRLAAAEEDGVQEASSPCLPLQAAISASLARSAHRSGFITSLWELRCPNEYACELATILWIAEIQHTPIFVQSPCLQNAVLAVCLASIGKERKTEWMVREGFQLYGAAVKTLSTALSRLPPSTSPPDTMLVTTRVLAMHEVISGPVVQGHTGTHVHATNAWPTHKMGELALLTARSPKGFVEGPSHEMFLDARFMCTVAATTLRQATVLSRSDWKTIPWSKKPKSERDALIDIFVDLPGLLHQVDLITDCTRASAKTALARKCVEQATVCERSLLQWLETLAPEGWTLSGGPRLDLDNPTMENIKHANLMCLFWSIYSQVLTVMQCLDPLLSPLSPRDTAHSIETIRLCCQSIVRTLPIFFDKEARIVGCYQIVSFPMFFALDGLIRTEGDTVSEERLLVLDLFLRPAKGGGSLAQFITGLLEHSPCFQRTEAGQMMAILAQKAPSPETSTASVTTGTRDGTPHCPWFR